MSQQQSHSSGRAPQAATPATSSNTGQVTDANDLLNELRKVYWGSVEREARNMIEFYSDLCSLGDLALKPEIDLNVCCDSFKKIFDVWMGCQSGLDKDSTSDLYGEAINAAKDHFTAPRDKREWAARLILQASGLLDLDVLYEPTNGSQRYVKMQQSQPNVERVEICKEGRNTHVVRGITCSYCHSLIKSVAFYECREGCKSSCFYESLPEASGPPAFYIPGETPTQDEAVWKHYPAYRVCSVCMSITNTNILDPCDRGHLHEVTYSEPNIKGLKAFRSELIKTELHRQKGHDRGTSSNSSQDAGHVVKFIEKALRSTEGLWPTNPRLFLRTVGLMMKGHYAPSGNFHLSLMFGPLIFESGVPGTKHGVSISPRPPPAFFSDYGVGDVDDLWRMEKRPFFYWDRETGKPHRDARAEEFPFRPRPILACLKRVYSAAFSGFPERAQLREGAVVQRLMELGNSYMSLPREKEALRRRSALKELAEGLRSSLEICLGGEVDKHLSRIANILVERKDRGEWSILTNNCQLLVNLLLGGDDFEYVIPLPPKDLKEESFRWPRYLISFGNHIEGFGKSLYQPNGLITQYNQSNPAVDYDLIEYISKCVNTPSESHSKSLARLCWFPSTSLCSQVFLDTLWSLPGDSLSLLQFHLLRPPHKYRLNEEAWIKNRLCVMQALGVMATFMGAIGNALHRHLVARDGFLLSQITIPPARVLGNVRADERLRILDQLGPRWTFYDIVNRTPNAMSAVVESPARFWTSSRTEDDPVHGEEVVSRMLGWFLAPISAISPGVGAAIGGSLRLHEDCWVVVNIGSHTYVRQYLCKKLENVRDRLE
ncbi:uncharacterized protein B0H64DRAFT_423943 [Chaetomium fimeti]|uniref:Uncharacterized protein n=1 Tax=Chaetomium fimeti TaxID=1854472 RepID=A0AAE0HKF3_9PEZI|nr:hypothetical protein B0H64DRAFT_423943 [Chaetomium fimeti]